MTRAAEQLHVAQPALGAQIQQLEEEVGTLLLNRHSRGVSVTPAGQFLYERAQKILEMVAQTTRETAAFQAGHIETIRFGMSPSVVHLAASDMLARAASTIPNITLQLVEETSLVLFDALKRGELDMVLAHELPDNPGLTRTPWLHEELLFVTAPGPEETASVQSPADIVDTIPLADVMDTDLTMHFRLDGIRKVIETASETIHRKPRIAFEVQSPQALKILILDRSVASILPYGWVLPELRTGAMVARRIIEPQLIRTLYLVRSDKRFSESNELALCALLQSIRLRLLDYLGQLATPTLLR